MAGKEGDVIYEIRGDDSNLNRDLDAAQRKVERSAKKNANHTEQIERETAEAVKDSKDGVTDYHKKQNEERVNDDKETGRKREEVERTTGDRIKSIAGGSAKAIGSGMVAAGSAAVAAGAMAVKSAVDMDQAMNQFASATGKNAEETERYQKILENIYTNNYGEGFDDIAGAMAQIRQQIGPVVDGWDDASIQSFTESAFALRDTFDYDIQESVRAANTMMEQFGIDGEDAMGLIASGAQNGLDYSGELIDSINEYSVQFAKVGLDADDMFKIFQTGAETGAWNLDKIGDAVKEMSIRVIDGSDTTKEGFETIGLNADEMAAKFSAGGDSAKEAFKQTITALAEMEDPLAQNTAGVDLFGTMWEDLGPDVVTQLADIKDGAYDTADAMGSIKDVKYDDLGSMLEGLKRSAEMLILPLGEQLIPILTDLIEAVLPVLHEALPPLTDAIGQLIEQVAPVIENLLPILINTFTEIIPPLMEIINAVLPALVEIISALLPPLADLISAVLPVLLDLINAVLPIITALLPVLEPLIDIFAQIVKAILQCIAEALSPLIEAIQPVIDMVMSILVPVLELLGEVFSEVFKGIFEVVNKVISDVKKILDNIISFIKNVFTGNWKGAWENIKNIFKAIADSLGSIFKAPINFIIDLINGFIKGLNGIKIPDWVPGVGGMSFSIPTIPRLKTGIDFVPGDYYPAYLDYGERVLTQEENIKFTALGGLHGMETVLSTGSYNPEQKIVLGKGCIIVQSILDGKTLAEGTAPYMDVALGGMTNVKERGL